jgi:hypothetical protein
MWVDFRASSNDTIFTFQRLEQDFFWPVIRECRVRHTEHTPHFSGSAKFCREMNCNPPSCFSPDGLKVRASLGLANTDLYSPSLPSSLSQNHE